MITHDETLVTAIPLDVIYGVDLRISINIKSNSIRSRSSSIRVREANCKIKLVKRKRMETYYKKAKSIVSKYYDSENNIINYHGNN
jgi:hypothetical protein